MTHTAADDASKGSPPIEKAAHGNAPNIRASTCCDAHCDSVAGRVAKIEHSAAMEHIAATEHSATEASKATERSEGTEPSDATESSDANESSDAHQSGLACETRRAPPDANRSVWSRCGRWLIEDGPAAALVLAVRGYQVILGPFLGGHCRFQPTCSHYFIGAVKKHGPWRGAWRGTLRVLRCHPFHRGGYDPP